MKSFKNTLQESHFCGNVQGVSSNNSKNGVLFITILLLLNIFSWTLNTDSTIFQNGYSLGTTLEPASLKAKGIV